MNDRQAIEVVDLVKRFNGMAAVDGICFQVAIGQSTIFHPLIDLAVLLSFGALMLAAALAWFRRE